MNKAREIVELESKWDKMDSVSLVDNVRSIMHHGGCSKYNDYCQSMMDITDSSKHTVEAWMNNSRKNVKIPFLKVCKLLSHYDADIQKVLVDYKCDIEDHTEKYEYLYRKITE